MATPKELAVKHNIDDKTLSFIKGKAETNTPMDVVTPEKQAVYNAYQNYFKTEVERKAREGIALDTPNAWKNSIYQQVSSTLQPTDKAYYNANNIMSRQQSSSEAHLQSQNDLLKQSAQAQMQSADANYSKIRDQQINALQAELDQAVADGKMSIQEAELAFEKQKESIYAQNYLDSEYSKAQGQSRGIQNSQQFLGMEQTRQANTTSLLNNNMTDRDNKIFQINNRLNVIKSNTMRGINQAQTDYGYNMAGAEGQIQSQMFQNQFDMQNAEYNRLQNMQGELDMRAMEQNFVMAQMSQQQKYTLETLAKQQGYDLAKMDIQQQYALAQMAEQHGYNMGLQEHQQTWQAKQNGLDRTFQSKQNELDRSHQSNMAADSRAHDEAMQRLQVKLSDEQWDKQLARENRAYNVPSSTEYKVRVGQEKAGMTQMQIQTMFGVLTDIQLNNLGKRMENLPTLGLNPTQKQINSFNSQVKNINDYIKQVAPTNEMYEMFKIPTYSSGASMGATPASTSGSKNTTWATRTNYGAYTGGFGN